MKILDLVKAKPATVDKKVNKEDTVKQTGNSEQNHQQGTWYSWFSNLFQ